MGGAGIHDTDELLEDAPAGCCGISATALPVSIQFRQYPEKQVRRGLEATAEHKLTPAHHQRDISLPTAVACDGRRRRLLAFQRLATFNNLVY